MAQISRRLQIRVALLLWGGLLAFLAVEVGLRIQISFHNNLDLQQTATFFPPAFGHPSGHQAALGQLIRPSQVPEMIYELKPDLDTSYYHARVTTNSECLRAPRSYSRPKPAGTYRILLLGDSQTFGQGVEFEQTFGQLIETELNARSKGPVVEVINSGVDGYNTAQEAAFLAARGVEYEPDCVLILFIGNDLELPDFIDKYQSPLALDQFYLLSSISNTLRGDRLARLPDRYKPMVGMSGYQRALRSIGTVAQQHSISVINVFDTPSRLAALDNPQAWARVDELQVQLGITGHEIQFPGSPEYWLSDKNPHMNPLGHAELARQMLTAIKVP